MTTVIVPGRFCGPPDSANGGITAGLLATHLPFDAVEVTLRQPPPLDAPMDVRLTCEAADLVSDGAVIASARAAVLAVEVPAPVPYDAAVDAAAASPWLHDHPYPTCFVCGPAREPGDGLRIMPGPVGDTGLHAATWTPDTDHGDDDGLVRPELIWAALDCPTGFAAMADGAISILGRMTAGITRRPPVGAPLVVVSWLIDIDGRKQHAASALYDPDGAVVGSARATWIELR
ncbi:MAG: hypothetical protein RIE08_08745 [Acidimicrobiales bacterium]